MTPTSECNCGNCDKRGNDCKFGLAEMTKSFTEHTGCLSHPKAREVLMRDVVVELDKKKIPENDDESANYNFGIENAISLIRDGVKRE